MPTDTNVRARLAKSVVSINKMGSSSLVCDPIYERTSTFLVVKDGKDPRKHQEEGGRKCNARISSAIDQRIKSRRECTEGDDKSL